MIGVFDGEIDTSESVLCIHRAKKVEKDEKFFETHKLLILIEKMTFYEIFEKFLQKFSQKDLHLKKYRYIVSTPSGV